MNHTQQITNLTIEELEQRCAQLEQERARLEQQNAELTAKLNWLMEQLRISKHHQFGASSERTSPEQQQLNLFNEAETTRPRGPANTRGGF